MKISEQGFTERLPGQTQAGSVSGSTSRGSSGRGTSSAGTDTFQLSNLAAQLQKTDDSDGSRSARVSAIASAVQSNTFRIDFGQVSSAIVSEAIQGGAQ